MTSERIVDKVEKKRLSRMRLRESIQTYSKEKNTLENLIDLLCSSFGAQLLSAPFHKPKNLRSYGPNVNKRAVTVQLGSGEHNVILSITPCFFDDLQRLKRLSPRQSYIESHPHESYESKQHNNPPCFEIRIQEANLIESRVGHKLAIYLVDCSNNVYEQSEDQIEVYQDRYQLLYTRCPASQGGPKLPLKPLEDEAHSSGSSGYAPLEPQLCKVETMTFHAPKTPTHYLLADSLGEFVDQLRSDFQLK